MIKPLLAEDWNEAKLKFPVVVQKKIDGVRGINLEGMLTGRSLKLHKNRYATKVFSRPEFVGLDGELTYGSETSPTLCRDTSSALSTITGEPELTWHVFDFVTENTIDLPYTERLQRLYSYVFSLNHPQVKAVPHHYCTTLEEVLSWEDHYLNLGYEGLILRDPNGKHKSGRATVTKGELLRIKRFSEEDCVVLEVVEGQSNGNEAKTNALGHTERSSHQENMTPNGMVGTMICRMVKDVHDTHTKALLLSAGQIVTVSAGSMTHADRVMYFKHPEMLVGKTIKMKTFLKGIKDAPRFPTFNGFRSESDK